MTDYRAVMDLVLQGWSVRQVCSTVRCSHTTVPKARQTMAAHQITTHEQLAGISDEDMTTWCQMRVFGTGVLGTRYCRILGSWYRASRRSRPVVCCDRLFGSSVVTIQ